MVTPRADSLVVPLRSTRRRAMLPRSAASRRRTTGTRLSLIEPSSRAIVGLRGFVVLGILLFDTGIMPVGVLSLELFLVLMGFFVTRALLTEHHDSGTIRLVRFYLGRLKPLVPVLAITIGLALVAIVRLGTYDELDRFASQSIASIFMINNWEEIGADAIYAETFDRISPLGHLWVVAVIEQFFRLWPLLIFAVLALGRLLDRRFSRRSGPTAWQWSPLPATLVLVLSVAGVAFSTVAMRVSITSTDAERTYLGTDTHAVGLFAGAAAAAVGYLVTQRRSRRLLKHVVPRAATATRLRRAARSLLVSLASMASLIVLATLWARATSYTQLWLYTGGFTATAIVGAVLVLSLTSPVNQVSRFFLFTPLVGLGDVAYTLFIVHLPIFWAILKLAPAGSSWDVFVLGIPAAILAAVLIHYIAAEPLRRLRWNWPWRAVVATAVVATTAALWVIPPMKLASPVGTGDISVLALGDSLADNLSAALSYAETEDPEEPTEKVDQFTVTHAGMRGCGISDSSAYRSATGRETAAPADCGAWKKHWQESIRSAQPDIILIDVSRDAMTRQVDGAWTDLTDAATAQRYRESLDALVEATSDTGAVVMIATARLHTGDATPEQASALNALLDELAADDPRFALIDVQDEACTADACPTTTFLGQSMYTDDRVHFSDAGKKQISPWLTAEVLAAYRGAANATAAE